MLNFITKTRENLNEELQNFSFYEKSLEENRIKRKEKQKELILIRKVRDIVQLSAHVTQMQFQRDLSDIVSLALKIVFGEEYSFKIKFIPRRNSTEADLLLIKKGRELLPLEASGFGLCDVISVALRMSYWKLKNHSQNIRNCIIWDEPLRFLSPDLHELMAEMIKQISSSLGIQLIIVTQNEELKKISDKLFYIKRKNDISEVQEN